MSKHLPTPPLNLEELSSNITFGELQKMSFEECSDFIDKMRVELLKIWDEGRPPYVGLSEDDIIGKFKQLENYDTSDFFVKDELYKDYVGFIRNFSKMGTGVNQFFPALLKSKVNGYSIYDYLSNEELFRDFKYTIVQKVRFDKMYSYSKYFDNKMTFNRDDGSVVELSYEDNDEEGWELFEEVLKDYENSVKHPIGFWIEDYDFNKKNKELGRMRFSKEHIQSLDLDTRYHQYTDNRRGFNQLGDEKYYALRMYEKDTFLFPKIFQVLRLGLGQVAGNFPPLTARWIYEKYIPYNYGWDGRDVDELNEEFLFNRQQNIKSKIYDSSSGWGGRLLGALSSKYPIHYIGLDVNKSNQGCYESLGEFFNSKCGNRTPSELKYELEDSSIEEGINELYIETFEINKKHSIVSKEEQRDIDKKKEFNKSQRLQRLLNSKKVKHPNTFEIHYKGSEVIGDDDEFMSKHKGDVDLCFTSPPYFNKEIYSDDKEQSAIKFPNYEDWLSGFLEPTIKTYFDLLKEYRYCLINIADLKTGENQFYPLEQDTIQIAIKCGFEYHRKYGMVMTRTIGTSPTEMRNSWLDVKSQKTYKVENILIFMKPIQPPPPRPKDIKLFLIFAAARDFDDVVKTFRLYRDIFPHLRPNDLKKSIENKQLVWDKGVAIQFKTYQRRQTKGTFKIQVGDVHLQKIASQRNGKTKDVFKEWLEYVAEKLNDARIVLSVRQTNERAIKFYQKFGFEIVCDCKWNKEDGYVMVRG